MRETIPLIVVGAALWCAGAVAAGPIQLAEYRADQDAVATPLPAPAGAYHRRLDLIGRGLSRPLNVGTIEDSLETDFNLYGDSVAGVLGVFQQQRYWAGEPYGYARSVVLGPKLAISGASETFLYYGYDREDVLDDPLRYGLTGDAETTRTGLAQIWYLADRRAAITLGYEFEQGDRDRLYADMQGHGVNLSGRFPLFWGLQANLQADYTRLSYPEYEGAVDAVSDRHHFRAAISRSFTTRLHGGMQYSYLNEEFDVSPLSYRRHTWGLNFRYEY